MAAIKITTTPVHKIKLTSGKRNYFSWSCRSSPWQFSTVKAESMSGLLFMTVVPIL